MHHEMEKTPLYELIIASLPVALFMVDGDYRIIEFNRAAEEITGWSREEALGRSCSEVLQSSLCEGRCPLAKSLASGETCLGQEALIQRRDGSRLPIFFSSSALVDAGGGMLYGIEVFRDGTEVKKLEAQKKNIISLFTHDLKAPVAIIGGFVARLLSGKAGPLTAKQRQYLEAMERETSRLEQYILSFLEISRMEAGQVELQKKEVDLCDLLHDICGAFALKAREKNISLKTELPGGKFVLQGDRLQLTRVFSNLLDNAIKYSEPGKEVRVFCHCSGTGVEIVVEDEGRGIAPEQQPHIFEPFYRVPGESRMRGSMGLGLAAVKAIVEAHGGTVRVSSRPGKGSRFTVFLPAGAPDRQET